MIKPLVSILIVNYNGRYLLDDCLSSLQKTNFPKNRFEIILVDNNSQDDSITYIKRYFPNVRLIEAEENLGFTGGNNLALKYAQGKYIALLNSDTRVTPNWLKEMLKIALDPKVGIVAPKLFYNLPYLEITINSNFINKSDLDNSADFSPLGTLMDDIKCQNPQLTAQVWYKSGFYKQKRDNTFTRWTKGRAKILIPFDDRLKNEYIFTFYGYQSETKTNNKIEVKLEDKTLLQITLKPGEIGQYKVTIDKNEAIKCFKYLVQNAGNIILKDGRGRDRGSILRIKNQETREFYDINLDYYNKPKKLLAFCGAACLIKKKLINEVGFFDGFYFMYYEDLDLSLRAWKNGWDIAYAPKAIIYHKHRATTGSSDSGFFINLVERNHLSFTLTHLPLKVFAIEFLLFLFRITISQLKAILFQFTDNLKSAMEWEVKTEARIQALKFIIIHFIRIYKKRLFWQNCKRTYIQMEKLLY